MRRALSVKSTLAVIISAALIASAAGSANAQVTEQSPIRAVIANDYTETYKAYLNGEVEVDESSGVMLAPYKMPSNNLQPSCALPSSYKTQTTPIRDQGGNNTCWAFSGIGTLEAFLSKDGKGNNDLSEQHLSWWATSQYNDNNGTGWLHNDLSSGGYSMMSSGYFISWQGPKLESQLPYEGMSYPSNMKSYDNTYNVTGIKYIANNTISIKTAVYNYGAVATSYNSGSGYNSDKSTYYSGEEVTYFNGHAVTIIGWDDDYPSSNFKYSPPGNGAWLAKNSWGDDHGDNGYIWISYYDRYAFDSDVWGQNYAVTSVRTATEYDRLYQNEQYGATYYTYMADMSGNRYQCLTFANVFDFDAQHKYLQNIVFETLNVGADYTLYYIPVEDDKPVKDESRWIQLDSGTIDDTGYVKADIHNFELPVGKGAVGVKIDASLLGSFASMGVDEWLMNSDGDYIFKPSTRRGDSFVITDKSVYDLLTVYTLNLDLLGGTLVIKAVATSNIIGDVDYDSDITVSDSIRVLRKSIDLESFDDECTINADVNFDGNIDSLDSLLILRKTVNLVSEF